jgi:hypothetical protein
MPYVRPSPQCLYNLDSDCTHTLSETTALLPHTANGVSVRARCILYPSLLSVSRAHWLLLIVSTQPQHIPVLPRSRHPQQNRYHPRPHPHAQSKENVGIRSRWCRDLILCRLVLCKGMYGMQRWLQLGNGGSDARLIFK